MLPERIAFVDLETTGTNPVNDRVTEIGIVTLDGDEINHWSSLIHPGCGIPEYIQQLTGIDNAMVADALGFDELADEIEQRLEGYLFVAHNARFDYGFLKNEFKRLGRRFNPDVLCTVKLSRKLYPQHRRHNLDSIIARHGLDVSSRHRALGDADLLWQLWMQLLVAHPEDRLIEAIGAQLKRPSLPPQLDASVLDELPDSAGVYFFYGEDDILLYVGKSIHLRQRVLSHFQADTSAYREFRMAQQVRRIDWKETAGELGALLLESRLIKELQPVHNRRLRKGGDLCSWQIMETNPGELSPRLECGNNLDLTANSRSYGLFRSKRDADKALRKIADDNQLCHRVLGLEKGAGKNRPCFAYQLHKCRGACVGEEPLVLHSARLVDALASLQLQHWPYPGPVAVVEIGEDDRTDIHVVDNWCHLGTVHSDADVFDVLEQRTEPCFDRDTYRILIKHMRGNNRITVLRTRV